MKKTITIFFALTVTLTLWAAQSYSVFKVKGAVEIVDGAGGNHLAEPREEVTLHTVVDIPDNGQIAILNNETKSIFRSVKTGRIKVAALISDARRQSDKTVKRAIDEMKNDVAQGSGGTKNKPQGAVMRDASPGALSLERVVADAILSGRSAEDMPLSYSKVYSSDSTYVFKITSTFDEPLYVNIASVVDKNAALLFDVRYTQGEPYVMVQKGDNVIDAFEFYGDDDANLVLIATNYPFDVQSVQAMLRNGLPSTTQTVIPEAIKLWVSTKR